MALLARFFGRTASEGAAFALGTAAGPALSPAVQELRNRAWETHPDRPVDAGTAAAIVAEAVELRDWGAGEAAKGGVDGGRFDAMVAEAREAPGVPQLLELWRRGLIDTAAFEHGLAKAKLETRWTGPLEGLQDVLLSPANLALGIVRSLLNDPGFLPVDLDTSGGKVPAYPVSGIDPVAEAGKSGVTKERLRVLVGSIGLPMSVQQAASALFRGIISRPDYNRAVLEGDTRPEWADPILEQSREIPSTATYVRAHLKGWIDEAAMNAGVAKHGMSAADANLLYLSGGRPAAPGQMATAWARGIDGPDGGPMDKAQFLKGIRESDIRPEWGEMLWGSRFAYPPLFQLSRLVDAGAIDADTAARWARFDRYPPEVVGALKAFWSQPTTGKADTHLGKAQNQLWTTVHRSYVADETGDADAAKALETLGVPGAVQTQVLALWKAERALIRKQLTPAQIKKAYQKMVKNPRTGVPWTREDAIEAVVARGYTLADAQTFIDT